MRDRDRDRRVTWTAFAILAMFKNERFETSFVNNKHLLQKCQPIDHSALPDLTLSMEDKDTLLVDVHSWVAANDTCSLGNTVRLVLCMKTII